MNIATEMKFKKYAKEMINRFACSLDKSDKIAYTEAIIADYVSENNTNKIVFAEQRGMVIGLIDHDNLQFACLWNSYVPHTTLFKASEINGLVSGFYKEFLKLNGDLNGEKTIHYKQRI